jgi:hypothetical protein
MPPLLHNLPAETADEVLSFLEPRDLYSLMALSSADRAHCRTPHFFRLVVLYKLHDRARAFSPPPKPLHDEAIAAMSIHELEAAATARDIDVKEKPTKPKEYYWRAMPDDVTPISPTKITSSMARAIPSPFSSIAVLRDVLKKWSAAVSGHLGFARSPPSFSSCHRSCAAPVLGLSSVSLSSPIWEHAAEFLMIDDEAAWADYDEYKKDVSAALSHIFKRTLCDGLADQHTSGTFLQPWSRFVPQRAAPKFALFDGPGLCLPMSGVVLPTYLDGAAIKQLRDAATPVRADGNRYSSLAPPLFSVTSSSWLRSVTDDSLTSVLSEATQTIAPDVSRSDVYAVASQIIILQEGDSIASFSPAAASAPGALATLFVDLPTDCISCVGQHTKKPIAKPIPIAEPIAEPYSGPPRLFRKLDPVAKLIKEKAERAAAQKAADLKQLPSLPVLQGGDLLATGDPTRVGGRSARADGSAITTKRLARSLGCPVLARGGLATDPNEAHGTLFSWLAVAAGQPVAVTPVRSGCKVILVFTLHHKDPLKSAAHLLRPPPIAYGDAVPVLHHLLPITCGDSSPRRMRVSISYTGVGSSGRRSRVNWGDANAMRTADPLTLFRIQASQAPISVWDCRPDVRFLAPSLTIPTPVNNQHHYQRNDSTFALDSNDDLLRGKDLALFELLEDAIGGQARKGDDAAKMVGWIGERSTGTGVWSDIASQLGGTGGVEALLADDADRYIPTSTSSGLRVVGSSLVAKDWNEGDTSVDWGVLDTNWGGGWCSHSDMDGGDEDLMIETNASAVDSLRSTKPETVDAGYDELWLIEVRTVPTITVQMRRD